jgi:hypothetical protein
LPRQAPPSPINGVCVPQRKYDKGIGRDDPSNRGCVLFIREDGTYLPVKEASEKIYGTLMDQDLPVLDGAGLTVTVRFEVNKHVILGDTGVHLVAQWPGYQSKEYLVSLLRLCYREEAEIQSSAAGRRLAWRASKGPPAQACHRNC